MLRGWGARLYSFAPLGANKKRSVLEDFAFSGNKKMTDEKQKKLIRLVHVGKSNLGWDDTAYRAFLQGGWGKESAADMTVSELEGALKAMRREGFAPKPRRVRPEEKGRATAAQLEYIKGMWAVCARNKSEAALLAFVKRVAHVDALRFLNVESARQVILALRDMMSKAGFNPDTSAAIGEAVSEKQG